MSSVVLYGYSFRDTEKYISVSGFYNDSRPLLEANASGSIQNFMELTWRNYQLQKECRKLPEVIHYLLECDRPNQPLEVRFLFAAIILESLKSTYAHSRNYEYDGSGFLRSEGNKPKCHDGSRCSKRYYSFRALLLEMFSDVGMTPDLKGIINLRNEVFHNGLSEKGYDHLTNTYDYAQDIIREYLLRLLGFKGNYMIYSSACRSFGSLS